MAEAERDGAEGETLPDTTKSARARWPALESNPESFTAFLRKLGVGETVAIHDVFGFEADLLMMIPQPIYAMIFLFPPKFEREKREEKSDKKGEEGSPFFLWQTKSLGNACGTIACIHALANCRSSIPLAEDSILAQYLQQATDLTYKERGSALETFEPMRKEQVKSASSGSNQTRMTEDRVEYHFVCFIEHHGDIYELDGMKQEPVKHGKCENFAIDVGRIIQSEFMAKMPEEHNFSTLALAPAGEGF